MPKLAKIRRRRKAGENNPKRNPPLGTDLVEYIAPGFAAFAATRVLTRIATVQITKRKPSLAKHAGAVAAIGAFIAAWWGAHRVKYLEKYHHPIVVGTGLATLQSLIQLYAPAFGKVLDVNPQLAPPPAPKLIASSPAQSTMPAAQPAAPIPQGFKPTTANEWYTYNDAYDAGSYKGKVEAAPPPVPGEDLQPDTDVSDLLDNSDLQLDNSDMGLFS